MAAPLPYEPCLVCHRGDTSTGFGLRGTAEAVAARLSFWFGYSAEDAWTIVENRIVHGDGPGIDGARRVGGQRRRGIHDWQYRLCHGCAHEVGIEVWEKRPDSRLLPGYDLSVWDDNPIKEDA